MSFLNERSIFLENWMFITPVLLLIATYIYVKENRKSSENKDVAPSNANLSSLAESEYIGEYQEENANSYDEYAPFLKEDEHIPFPGARVTLDGGAAKFYEIANDRRSVRKYSTRKVDISIIEKCIHAAGKIKWNRLSSQVEPTIDCLGTGPSGAHTEPWTFCVVENQTLKQQIRNIIEEEELENYTKRMSRKWTTDLRPLKTNHIKEYLTDAPYLILVFKKVFGTFNWQYHQQMKS